MAVISKFLSSLRNELIGMIESILEAGPLDVEVLDLAVQFLALDDSSLILLLPAQHAHKTALHRMNVLEGQTMVLAKTTRVFHFLNNNFLPI
jgi:hypothetical protein